MLKWIAVAVGSLVVLIVAAVAVALWTIDPDDLRGDLAAAASGALGREVRLGGKLDLEISLSPTAVVRDVSVANAPWGSAPQMVRVGRMEARVRLIPYLLSGELRVPRFRLDDAEILLEVNDDGVGNWVFAPGKAPTPEEGGSAPVPLPDAFAVENARIVYRGPKGTGSRTVVVKRITGAAENDNGPVRLTWDVAYDDVAVTGQGEIGSVRALADAASPYPVSLSASALGVDVGLAGKIANRASDPRADLRVTLKSKDPSTLGPLLGGAHVPALPLELSAEVSAAANEMRVQTFRVAFGTSRLAGSLTFGARKPRPRIEGEITGERLDLVELMAPRGPADTLEPAGDRKDGRSDDRVFPDDPLPLEALGIADARLDMRIAELVTPTVAAREVQAKLVLENARLQLPSFAATVAGSRIDASASIDGRGDVPRLAFALRSSAFDLGRFLQEAGVEDVVDTKGEFDVDLRGSGRSVAAVMAGLDGDVRALFGGGRIKAGKLDALVGGISTILQNLALGSSDWAKLNCLAHHMPVADGIASNKLLLIDTENVTIVGEGTIDLKRERLQMKVTPRPKSATLNVAVPVRIGGTLARPSFRPDEVGALTKIGGLLGAVLFPPAAIAAFADLGASDQHPCAKVVSASSPGGRPADNAEDKTKPKGGTPGDAIRDIGEGLERGLKGLFGR